MNVKGLQGNGDETSRTESPVKRSRIQQLGGRGCDLVRDGVGMNFEELLRKNMNGLDEIDESENVLIDTFPKRSAWDGVTEFSVL